MKFGMNLLLWTDRLSDEMLPIVKNLKQMGYDGVELPIFDLEPKNYALWAKRLDDLGLDRTAVAVRFVDDNPISPDPQVRAAGVANNKRALDCCQAAGAKLLGGPFHSALGHFTGKGPTADEWKWGVDGMRQVAEHAATTGVTLALEYLNRFEAYLLTSAVDAVRFIKEVNHPNCRTMYDTFHANIEEKNVADAIRTIAPVMAHVHISENDRSTPGTGLVPWKDTFDTLREVRYDGWLMVEAFGMALPSLAAATKIWRRMFTSEEQLARDALTFIKREWQQRSGR